MKQVLAVRVGAKKAVGHIVSKRWWPTVSARLVVTLSLVTFVLATSPSIVVHPSWSDTYSCLEAGVLE